MPSVNVRAQQMPGQYDAAPPQQQSMDISSDSGEGVPSRTDALKNRAQRILMQLGLLVPDAQQ